MDMGYICIIIYICMCVVFEHVYNPHSGTPHSSSSGSAQSSSRNSGWLLSVSVSNLFSMV